MVAAKTILCLLAPGSCFSLRLDPPPVLCSWDPPPVSYLESYLASSPLVAF